MMSNNKENEETVINKENEECEELTKIEEQEEAVTKDDNDDEEKDAEQDRQSPDLITKPPIVSIDLGDVTPHNIKQLKCINQVVFPVTYTEKFYRDVLDSGELAKLAFFNDLVVGAVCCRVDVDAESLRHMYIMTLGCLAAYRRLGIGRAMLNHVLRMCERDGNIATIFLHVQVNNTTAIDFYKKFNFEIKDTKANYYKRIEPADAHVLVRVLKPWSTEDVATNKPAGRQGKHHR